MQIVSRDYAFITLFEAFSFRTNAFIANIRLFYAFYSQ